MYSGGKYSLLINDDGGNLVSREDLDNDGSGVDDVLVWQPGCLWWWRWWWRWNVDNDDACMPPRLTDWSRTWSPIPSPCGSSFPSTSSSPSVKWSFPSRDLPLPIRRWAYVTLVEMRCDGDDDDDDGDDDGCGGNGGGDDDDGGNDDCCWSIMITLKTEMVHWYIFWWQRSFFCHPHLHRRFFHHSRLRRPWSQSFRRRGFSRPGLET